MKETKCYYLSVPYKNDWEGIYVKNGVYTPKNYTYCIVGGQDDLEKICHEVRELFANSKHARPKDGDSECYHINVYTQSDIKTLKYEKITGVKEVRNQLKSYNSNCFVNKDDVENMLTALKNKLHLALPKFMVDDSCNDGQVESIMDYVLSWCLRCAAEECAQNKPILHSQCKLILCKILGIESPDSVTFSEVKTWKQENKIDIWVELTLERNGEREQHSILIENKYYGEIRSTAQGKSQLEKYKTEFDNYYDKCDDVWNRHYVLITCIKREDEKFTKYYNKAPSLGYKVFTISELLGEFPKETESDIFNEFWIRW